MNKEYKSFLKTVGGNEGSKCHYSTRLDTYGCGCQHDCKYCYAKSLLSFRGLWNVKEPAIADIEKIKKKIAHLDKNKIVRLGGMTDCFQPLEKEKRVTYQTIQELNKRGIGYLIVTKSAMVADDEYIEILDKDLAHIQVTITTMDDKKSLTYEKASPSSKRLMAIKKLQDAGFDVAIRISPYIPSYIDIAELQKYGIKKAIIEFLRVNTWIKRWFDIDYSEYTLKQNSYLHMPLAKKIYYVRAIKDIFEEVSICEDEDNAYDFWKENFNPNPNDCCNLK